MACEKSRKGAVIDGVAANAAESERTAIIDARVADNIGLSVEITQSAASAVSAAIYKSANNGASFARVPSISISSGAGTARDYTLTKAITGSDTVWMDIDTRNCDYVKVIVSATGGGASDLLTVYAIASTPW